MWISSLIPFLSTLQVMLMSSASVPFLTVDAFAPSNHARPQWQRRLAAVDASVRSSSRTIDGPPISTKPDYSSIHGPLGSLIDGILMSFFRMKLAERLDRPDNTVRTRDSQLPPNDFAGIIELTSAMNSGRSNRTEVQEMATEVLVSLFPGFILDRFPSWFARPFPEFSARMCAWATVVGGTWLMGECEVNDVPDAGDGGMSQGVLVRRCRFLEESQCASICVNSCKIPTQNFFSRHMGLALTMTPDYETGECQFAYGRAPTEEDEREARETPCLMRCPSGGGMRGWHNGDTGVGREQWLEDLEALARANGVEREQWLEDLEALARAKDQSNCLLMED